MDRSHISLEEFKRLESKRAEIANKARALIRFLKEP